MARMNKFTLLDDAMRGFGGAAAGGEVGEAGRQRQLVGLRDPGGVRRRLFGVGEGPAEAVAEAKQENMEAMRKQCVRKLVIKQWIVRRTPSDDGSDGAALGICARSCWSVAPAVTSTMANQSALRQARNGSTQAGVSNKMRNNDLRLGCGHASVVLRSASQVFI